MTAMNPTAPRHALFAAIPAWGHLRPLAVQAAELARRGWRATLLSADEMRRHVEGRYPGVEFVGVGPTAGGERHVAEVHARASAETDFVRSTAIMSAWALEHWLMLFDGARAALRARPTDVAVVRARLPPTARVVPWVSSSLGVLAHPNVRVFLSHAGINSAYEAIVAGTPVVALPLFVDQRDMARRLADAGMAEVLDKTTVTADDVAAALRRVAADDAYRRALPTLQSCVRLAGGAARAADLIEHVASHGAAHLVAPVRG